ncbi:YdcF family protein [Streptomyces sp. NBC_00568]|uniref:YdcF family protein n=1 Tax=Streptomyces sp. NBC_00568 TaxID=2975779 RepID=UPI0022593CD7|nr:YdcF family protein [Streptomyces sp. NBC_00568]MCX4993512.1 YdcF family protein [Streptomyces sp. NBC_00568]
MLIFSLVGAALTLFSIGVLTDPRRFINAVMLGLALTLLAIGLVDLAMTAAAGLLFGTLALVVVALLFGGVLFFVYYLITNGLEMLRKEGRRLGNLLSLLAGVAIVVVGVLFPVAVYADLDLLTLAMGITLGLLCYFAFLFACFVTYGYLYGRLKVRKQLDFVVVLGSGLIGGTRVPPLLASRLERAREVCESQAAQHGIRPTLITSGGQGADESMPEAEAMAQYLIDRGFPADTIVKENQSRTTLENLRFSKAIMEGSKPKYRCAVVTNNFHVFRAALIARDIGMRGQVLGSPTAAYFLPSATLREFAAILISRCKLANLAVSLVIIQQCWAIVA